MDQATVVVRQIDASSVGPTLEHKTAAIWRKLRLLRNEIAWRHTEELGNLRNLGIVHAHNAVLYAAARTAAAARERPTPNHRFRYAPRNRGNRH